MNPSDAGPKTGLDMMVIMKGRQEQKWALKEKLKAIETTTEKKEVPPIVEDISVVVVGDDKEDDNLDPHIVKGRRSSQATDE